MDLQADAWQAAAQLRQTLTEQIFRWVAYAVMQRGLGRTFGLPLKRFQPGQEGGYANPGGNPVLATIDLVIVEVDGAKLMRRHDPAVGLVMFSPRCNAA